MMLELLKAKFGDCKFQHVKQCDGSFIKINENSFFIFDPPNELNEPVRIVTVEDEHQLKITNAGTDIYVVKTDKCLFKDAVSKCDCLLFSDSAFYLVEIKSSGKKTRGEHRLRAVEQLGATLDILAEKDIDITHLNAKAVICFKSLKPYIIKTSLLSYRAIFQQKYSVDLVEGNVIDF